MMKTCEEYEGLRAGCADGTLAGGQRELMTAHLEQCPRCAADVAVQTAVRDTLRARASSLRESAPAELRARIVEAQSAGPKVVAFTPRSTPAVAPPGRSWVTRFVPASAAAALVLAVGGVIAAGALAPQGGVLAAQLALDHLKCRLVASVSTDVRSSDLEQAWAAQRGWPITVPPSSAEAGVALVGLRNCWYHDGTMAHVMYDFHGRRLSLFVMPHSETAAPALDVIRQQTRTWTAEGRTYALVGSQDAGDLTGVVEYMRQTAR